MYTLEQLTDRSRALLTAEEQCRIARQAEAWAMQQDDGSTDSFKLIQEAKRIADTCAATYAQLLSIEVTA